MIKNDRAYSVTKAAAEKFARALEEHEAKPIEEGASEIGRAAELSAMRAQLADLRTEIAEYEQLRAGGIEDLLCTRLEDLPALLIRARIAEGLTHEQLGKRLDVKPQQIQRWEEDDYQSAAFWRLIEVADALGLSIDIHARLSEPSVPDVSIVVDKLRKAGVDKSFLKSTLVPTSEDSAPKKAARVSAERLEAIFARPFLDLVAINDDKAWERLAMANARFKVPARAKDASVAVFAAHAYFLVESLCDTRPMRRSHALPREWEHMHSWLFGSGEPSLRAAVVRLWDAGIPVLPLSYAGGPHGACWRIRGRGAIVLKQPLRTESRWLFDLVHELNHLAEAQDCEEFELLEGNGKSEERRLSPEEQRAHAFAANVLLRGKADSLYAAVIEDARRQPARIKRSIQRIATSQDVEVGLLANHVAFRCAQEKVGNIWGAAQKLQRTSDVEPFAVVREVLFEKIDIQAIPEPAAGLLQQALS